ncbi:MAG: hypothetical protein ACK55X_08180 [Synechococcaceae cyanobacterium]|jgi:hypothetical protein
MATQSASSAQAELFYRRLGQVFLAIFAINSVFALLPVRLTDSRWQLTLVEALKNTAPLAVLGVALLFLVPFVRTGRLDGSNYPLQQRVRKLAPFAALGFFLLIPLQMHASWVQLRQADVESQRTLRAVERRINQFSNARSNEELRQITSGLPSALQPRLEEDVNSNRRRLVDSIQPRLAAVRTQTSARKRQVIQRRIKEVLNDSLVCAAYGFGFLAVRRASSQSLELNKQAAAQPKSANWLKLQRRLKRFRRSMMGRPSRQ